jgi:hypothetical protein
LKGEKPGMERYMSSENLEAYSEAQMAMRQRIVHCQNVQGCATKIAPFIIAVVWFSGLVEPVHAILYPIILSLLIDSHFAGKIADIEQEWEMLRIDTRIDDQDKRAFYHGNSRYRNYAEFYGRNYGFRRIPNYLPSTNPR